MGIGNLTREHDPLMDKQASWMAKQEHCTNKAKQLIPKEAQQKKSVMHLRSIHVEAFNNLKAATRGCNMTKGNLVRANAAARVCRICQHLADLLASIMAKFQNQNFRP